MSAALAMLLFCNYSEQYSQNRIFDAFFCSYKLLRQRNMSGCSYKCKHSTNIRSYFMALNRYIIFS